MPPHFSDSERPATTDTARSRKGVPWTPSLLFAAAAFAATSAVAAPQAGATIAQKGVAGAPACMTCHGANGEGQAAAGFPRLAGQPAAYLRKQLDDFASGARKNATMEPFARALSDAQKQDAADYYASLPGWKAPKSTTGAKAESSGKSGAGGKSDSSGKSDGVGKSGSGASATASTSGGDTKDSTPQATPNDTGYTLATRGNWPKGVPACYACHGVGGDGVPPHFPALSGQPASYIKAQLNAWKTGTRTNDPQDLMKSVAMRLSESEVNAVSAFFEHPVQNGKGK